MSDLSKKIGLAIRQARINAGLTQVQFSTKAGISQALLSAYENGTENLTAAQTERLFDALGMDVEVVGKLRN